MHTTVDKRKQTAANAEAESKQTFTPPPPFIRFIAQRWRDDNKNEVCGLGMGVGRGETYPKKLFFSVNSMTITFLANLNTLTAAIVP